MLTNNNHSTSHHHTQTTLSSFNSSPIPNNPTITEHLRDLASKGLSEESPSFVCPPDLHTIATCEPVTVHHDHPLSLSHVGIGFWNVNGNSIDKALTWHSWMLQQHSIDVLVMIDSRDPPALGAVLKNALRHELPQHSVAITNTSSPLSTAKLVIGGITMLVAPRLAPRRIKTWSDPSGLGLILATTFRTPSNELLLVIGVYVPVPHSNPESDQLEAQLHRWLRDQGRPLDTMLYLRTALESRIQKQLRMANSKIVIGGDFNLLSDEVRRDLLPFPAIRAPFDHEQTADIPTRFASGRRIDHIFTLQADILSHSILTEELLESVSDHVPLWCQIGLNIPTTQLTKSLLSTARPSEKLLKTKSGKQDYQKKLHAWILANHDSSLDTLCSYSTKLLTPKTRSQRKRRKTWSVEMKALTYWINMLIRLHRASKSPDRFCIPTIFQETETMISKINPAGPTLLKNLQETYPLSTDMSNDPCMLLLFKKTALKALRCSTRSAQSAWIRQALNRREDNFKSGRIGVVIRSLLQESRHDFDMLHIRTDNDDIITDPTQCHEELTATFVNWFKATAKNVAPNGVSLWSLWHQNEHQLRDHLTQTRIPIELHETIIKGILHSDNDRREAIHHSLGSCAQITPSLKEFEDAIQDSPSGSAGGPIGLTYTMIRAWPKSVVTWVHTELTKMWVSGQFPAWWSTKLLVPIPKKDDPTLSDLRPIMLLEPIRKLWMGTIIRKIMASWEQQGILSENQYGFRKHKSCGHAVLQLINSMEEAEEEATSILISSWDIKRAFDSISRELIQFSLERLGVPTDIASIIATMDAEDKVTVASPWCRAHGSSPRVKSFSTHQGTGQGDIVSPTLWTAFFDILLKTLEADTRSHNFYVRGAAGHIIAQPDLAYADDLISIAATKEALQRKADLVSAFALSFHLQLAIPKFRTAIVDWSGTRPTSRNDEEGILIHGKDWAPTLVPFTQDPSLRYLGSQQNLDNSGSIDAAKILDLIQKITSKLRCRGGSAEMHVMVTNAVIHSRAAYAGAFGCWSLGHYRKWDVIIARFLKEKLHLPASFPNDLLYAPLSAGGMGLVRCSDKIQQAKQRLLTRCSNGTSGSQTAAAGVLDRLARRCGHYLCSDGNKIFLDRIPERVTYWARSLVEYLNEGGLAMRSPPVYAPTIWDTNIITSCPSLAPSLDFLLQFNITTIGDVIVDARTSTFSIWPCLSEDLPTAVPLISAISMEHQKSPLPVRPGQTWIRTQNGKFQTVVEVLGWTSTDVMVRFWGTPSDWSRREASLPKFTGLTHRKLFGQSTTLGCGSNDTIPWELFVLECGHKAITSGDIFLKSFGLYRTLLGWTRWSPARPILNSPHRPPWLPQLDLTADSIICTDGSWQADDSELLLGPSLLHQGCGLVVLAGPNAIVPSFSLTVKDNSFVSPFRAFTMEMFAITLGLQAAQWLTPPPCIYSDCQGAITLSRHCRSTHPLYPLAHISQVIAAGLPPSLDNLPAVRWVAAHAESRREFPAFSTLDWGNYWADKAAGGKITDNPGSLPHTPDWTHVALNFHDLLADPSFRGTTWATFKEDEVFIGNVRHYKTDLNLQAYLKHRSETKDTGLGPWLPDNLLFLMAACNPRTLRQRSALLQLYLARFDRDRLAATETPTICMCKSGTAHLQHWITDCTLPAMQDAKLDLRHDLQQLFGRTQGTLSAWFISRLMDHHDENLWRGIWSTDSYAIASSLSSTSVGIRRQLLAATRLVTTTSLDMHSTDTQLRRSPALAASRGSRRSLDRPHFSNTLLNYGFLRESAPRPAVERPNSEKGSLN